MKARKGLFAIVIFVVPCIISITVISYFGWNKINQNYIDIDRSKLEEYFRNNQINCKLKKDQSAVGFVENYMCNTNEGIENTNIYLGYLFFMHKPFIVDIGTDHPLELNKKNSDIGKVVDILLGIPYKDSNPKEAREWFWGIIEEGNTTDLFVQKTISEVTFTVINDEKAGFILSIKSKEQSR